MKLIKQTGPYCLVTSAAMLLDTTTEILHAEIGMTGTDIWWPPNLMRGIHIQEIQTCALNRGYCFSPIEVNPHLCPGTNPTLEPKAIWTGNLVAEFHSKIVCRKAILITHNHAVAWDGDIVYDPKGFLKSFNDYEFIEAWLLCRI